MTILRIQIDSPAMALLALLMLASAALPAAAEDWPRWRGPRADGTWQAPAIDDALPASGLRTVWTRPIGGGYSGVTVAGGRVYTMERQLDPEPGIERIVCLDAASGEPRWAHTYTADYGDLPYGTGPRASVTIDGGRAYALGAVGHLHCLDAETGKVIWAVNSMKELAAERPMWGFAGSPLIHGDLVICHIGARPAGTAVAFNRHTGEVGWRGGDDAAGYSAPYLINHHGHEQIVLWTPNAVLALDPASGAVQWRFPFEVRYGVSIADPIFHENLLLIASYWHGSRALRLGPAPHDVQLAWSTAERELSGLMSQPLYRDGLGYLLDKSNGLTCFEYTTGKRLWDDGHRMTPRGRNPQASLIWTGHADRALVLNSDGDLIHARLNREGYSELWRANIVGETWAHPAFAGRFVFARSDKQIVCVELPVSRR